MPYVWLGDNDRGLAWFAESDQGWAVEPADDALVVRHEEDAVALRVNLINTPTHLAGSRQYVFGLQATPVKPIPPSGVRLLSVGSHLPVWHWQPACAASALVQRGEADRGAAGATTACKLGLHPALPDGDGVLRLHMAPMSWRMLVLSEPK